MATNRLWSSPSHASRCLWPITCLRLSHQCEAGPFFLFLNRKWVTKPGVVQVVRLKRSLCRCLRLRGATNRGGDVGEEEEGEEEDEQEMGEEKKEKLNRE